MILVKMMSSDVLMKAGVTAGVASVGSLLLFGESGSVPVFGMNVPGFLVSGLTGAVSSVLADEANKYIVPNIPLDKKWSQIESIATHGVSGAAVFTGTTKVLIPQVPNSQLSTLALFGAGSVLAGDFVYHGFVKPQAGANLF